MRRPIILWCALATLCLCGCGGDKPKTPAEIKQAILLARDEAKAARDKKDAKAAEKAAGRAEERLTTLRKLTERKETAAEAGAILAESEAAAREARYWAELAGEEKRLADKVSGIKARSYRAGRGMALTTLFKGLALAADQAGKQGLDKLPQPIQDAAGSAARLAAELTGRAPLPDGNPDWAGISSDMNALAKSPPAKLQLLLAAALVVCAQDNFALYEIEALDPAALTSNEQRIACQALRGWIYSLHGFSRLSAREFEALTAQDAAPAGADRCREILAGVHLFMALEHCSKKDYAAADLELSRALKVMPDEWFTELQKGMAEVVECERQAAESNGEKGADGLYKLSAATDGEWLARRLAQRAEEVRAKKGKAGPFLGDPTFKREIVMHLVGQAARKSPAAKQCQKYLDLAGGLGRRFVNLLPGSSAPGPESPPPEAAPTAQP